MLTPEQVFAEVTVRAGVRAEPLLAYWVHVAADRAKFGAALRALRGAAQVVPVAVNDGFSNPNALLADIARVLDDARSEILERANTPGASPTQVVLVLLGRTTLDIPQVTSPITLPAWFPGSRGDTAYVLVEDLTYSASDSLKCDECRVPEICEHLFALDGALTERLRAVSAVDRNAGMAFFERIRDSKSGSAAPGETFASFLEIAESTRATVTDAAGFRPSARDGKFLISRIVRLVSSCSPDELSATGKALATALALGAPLPETRESFFSVVARSANPTTSLESRFGRNVLVAVSAASQLVTAAAHAGEFLTYPVLLLRSAAFDLLRTLDDIVSAVKCASPPEQRGGAGAAAPAEPQSTARSPR